MINQDKALEETRKLWYGKLSWQNQVILRSYEQRRMNALTNISSNVYVSKLILCELIEGKARALLEEGNG